jgi:uncharacterized protein (TIRG00374 family)
MTRIAIFVALFVAFAAGGIWWGVHSSGVQLGDLGELWSLPIAALVTLVLLCAGIYVTDMIRYRAFGRAVGESVSWRAALDATVANFFFSWITPGAALGAPAAIVMLGRRGVSWEGAALIAFGKSVTSIAVLLMIAFVVLATGHGPDLDGRVLAAFTSGTGVVGGILSVLVIGALWPRTMVRGIDRFEGWLLRRKLFSRERGQRGVRKACGGLRNTIERLGKLRTGGAFGPLGILFAHLAYLGVFVATAVVLALGFGASDAGAAISISIVYTAFTYVAPTPGGAGLSEAVGVIFYGSILPAREAVLVVLLFRALTFYLHIVIGVTYLGIVGGTRQILAHKRGGPTAGEHDKGAPT